MLMSGDLVFLMKHKGKITIKTTSGVKIKTFLQCQNNAFPIIFSNKVNISVKLIYFHAFFILDNFNEEKISLTTFIRFKECEKMF